MYQGLNQFDTQRKMFAGKPEKDHYEKGYLAMQKFFGQKIYQSLSATRKNRWGIKNNAAQLNIAKVFIWIIVNKNILIDFFDY